MQYRFRNEVIYAKKAAMGEMFNLASENLAPGDKIINFASGHPSTEVFQDGFIKKYINLALQEADKDSFQYGPHAGYAPLRKEFIKFANEKGNIVKQKDDLIVTYGAVEAIFLTASTLIARGDCAIVEVPSYVNAIKALQLQGAEVIGVRMEADGVDISDLERAMRQGAKIYYTIPNFGNPSGITMSFEKRKAVCELAEKYNVVIIEDNSYGDLRYRNERIPSIKEFDKEGVVVYVASMSKLIAPAIRIGFMVADKEIIRRAITIKAVTTNGVTSITQTALARMFEENDMYEQIQKICDIYGQKLVLMESMMNECFPSVVKWSSPDGGMYIWVTMPEGIDVEALCRESAINLHIPITPGSGFCITDPEKCTSMRFNFAKESLSDIEYGIKKVGELMRKYL